MLNATANLDIRSQSQSQFSQAFTPQVWLFLISQQFSLRVPDLQAMAVSYVMIWPQRFGGFER
jgi:hypothetical protein